MKRKTKKKGSTIIFTIGVEEIGDACALVLLKADFLLSVPQQNQSKCCFKLNASPCIADIGASMTEIY